MPILQPNVQLKPSVVTLTGPIASGKSTIASSLAITTGWAYASFGNFLRNEAKRRKLDAGNRETLQEIGIEFIKRGWPQFCQSVIEEASWDYGKGLVVDGIRHIEALWTIRKLVEPLSVILVYVDLEESIRRRRHLDRGQRIVDIYGYERHETEYQVLTGLRNEADLRLDGDSCPEINVNRIILFTQANSGV